MLPLARPGFLTAGVLGFAHTVGEFGVVLMIGGNIPGQTRVVSVQIYDHVEALEYAGPLAGGLTCCCSRSSMLFASTASTRCRARAGRNDPAPSRCNWLTLVLRWTSTCGSPAEVSARHLRRPGPGTTLRAVAGLETMTRAAPWSAMRSAGQRTRASSCHRRTGGAGHGLSGCRAFSPQRCAENLLSACAAWGAGARVAAAKGVVALFGIGSLLDQRPQRLSGANSSASPSRGLLAEPWLLLMDEPLAALDDSARPKVVPWLERLHDELAIPRCSMSSFAARGRPAGRPSGAARRRRVRGSPLAELLPRTDLPLSHGEEAFVMIDAGVADYDAAYALARLDVAGQSLWATSPPRAPGSRLRVRIQARDVSLARTPQHDSSILNTLATTLVALERSPSRVLARLDISQGGSLLARLTMKSADALQLAVGQSIHAQIKSVALLD